MKTFLKGAAALAALLFVTAQAALAQDAHYPLTIESYNQDGVLVEQVFESAPERVVSISQANTELLLALGLGDRIIATAHRFSPVDPNYADEYNAIPFIAESGYPSREVVIDQDPDLIVGWGSLFADDALGAAEEWHARGVHTYLMTNTVTGLGDRTIEWLYEDIETLGQIFDIEERAAELIEEMQTRIAAVQDVVSQIPEDERVSVVSLQYVYENEWLGRGGTDLNRNLVELAGGNHLNDNGQQSMEILLDLNPDYLVIIDLSSSPTAEKREALEANPSLASITAIRNDAYFSLDHVSFYCGAPRVVDAIEAMARAFYPDHFPDA